MKREPTRREQLRRAFHGPVLKDISEQVRHQHQDGKWYGYTREFWKIYYAQLFDAPLVEKPNDDGDIEMVHSTEAFDDDSYALFLTKVQAHAASEWGVTFTEKGPRP